MKKLVLFFTAILFLSAAKAQVPQALNYQAVARTSLGLIIPDQSVGVRFSILEGSATGVLLYQETALTNTNSFGLFTLAVGNGTPVFGSFPAINWSNGLLKYLKVEIAPQGGTVYGVQGASVLLSVPFALYAEKTKLVAGNAITITGGNTIAANYTGTNGVSVTGSTISGNYIGGAGINITGNVITNTLAGNQWLPDAFGIYYQNPLGGVGIGGNTESAAALSVTQKATGGFSAAAAFKGSDSWHTVVRFDNTSAGQNQSYSFALAGSGNTAQPPKSFSLYNHQAAKFVWLSDDTNNAYMGVGSYNGIASMPKSRLHVFNGDVNIDQIGSGIIMKSPNGQCWRITIDNAGNFVRTAITCP
jgi:hypothetical protein